MCVIACNRFRDDERRKKKHRTETNRIRIIIISRINGYIDGYLCERAHSIRIGSSINMKTRQPFDEHREPYIQEYTYICSDSFFHLWKYIQVECVEFFIYIKNILIFFESHKCINYSLILVNNINKCSKRVQQKYCIPLFQFVNFKDCNCSAGTSSKRPPVMYVLVEPMPQNARRIEKK